MVGRWLTAGGLAAVDSGKAARRRANLARAEIAARQRIIGGPNAEQSNNKLKRLTMWQAAVMGASVSSSWTAKQEHDKQSVDLSLGSSGDGSSGKSVTAKALVRLVSIAAASLLGGSGGARQWEQRQWAASNGDVSSGSGTRIGATAVIRGLSCSGND
ncbi:hypothetical protein NL676_009129 [Syzygium grande]|nr:hypothetical protein NL676_009129 [Syzygium grande]